MNYYAAALCIT